VRRFSATVSNREEKFSCERSLDAVVSIPSLSKKFDFAQIQAELQGVWEWEYGKLALKHQGFKKKDSAVVKASYGASEEEERKYWFYLDQEMSSNCAGEAGAVGIYQGALSAVRLWGKYYQNVGTTNIGAWEEVRFFAEEHLQTESEHLEALLKLVPRSMRTSYLSTWRGFGWTLGFLPTFVGRGRGLYFTVHAVESFVEGHYLSQVQWLRKVHKEEPEIFSKVGLGRTIIKKGRSMPLDSELARFLEHCCSDEVEHKEDAQRRLLRGSSSKIGVVGRLWAVAVTYGCRVGVALSKRI